VGNERDKGRKGDRENGRKVKSEFMKTLCYTAVKIKSLIFTAKKNDHLHYKSVSIYFR
jgi:hypothetical protein